MVTKAQLHAHLGMLLAFLVPLTWPPEGGHRNFTYSFVACVVCAYYFIQAIRFWVRDLYAEV